MDRQEVLSRLQMIPLPQNIQPTISPWSAIAGIYRHEQIGEKQTLTNLKTVQYWQIRFELVGQNATNNHLIFSI